MAKHRQHVKNIMLGTCSSLSKMLGCCLRNWLKKHMSYIRTMQKNMYVVLKKHQFNVLLLENWGRNGWWSHWAKHAFHFGYPNTMAKGDDN